MRPVTLPAQSASGAGTMIVPDYRGNGFPLTLSVVLSAGASLTYKAQYTTDDVFASGFSAGSANWFDHPTMTGQTASGTANMMLPVTGVRLNVTTYVSGSATFKVIEAVGKAG